MPEASIADMLTHLLQPMQDMSKKQSLSWVQTVVSLVSAKTAGRSPRYKTAKIIRKTRLKLWGNIFLNYPATEGLCKAQLRRHVLIHNLKGAPHFFNQKFHKRVFTFPLGKFQDFVIFRFSYILNDDGR